MAGMKKVFRKRYSKKPSPAVKAYVRSVMNRNVEKKSITSSQAPTLVGSTVGTLLSPCGINQGVQANQRVGNRLKASSIYLNMIFDWAGSTTQTLDDVRFMVVMARKGNSYTTSDFPQYYAPIDTDKFKVLYDTYFSVAANVNSSGTFVGTLTKVIKKRIKLNSLHIYNDGTLRPENQEVLIYAFCKNNCTNMSGFYQLTYHDA